MARLLVITLLVFGVAAIASPQGGGNSQCAQWCAANFPQPGSTCTSLAAQGGGPCYTCGPLKTSPTEMLCGGKCSETSTDSNNCGGCGFVCKSGTTCTSGACVCTNTGKPPCNDGTCPALSTDVNNCGTCGNKCPVGGGCVNGVCSNPPPATCSTVLQSPNGDNYCSSPATAYCGDPPNGDGYCICLQRVDGGSNVCSDVSGVNTIGCSKDSDCASSGQACIYYCGSPVAQQFCVNANDCSAPTSKLFRRHLDNVSPAF